MKRDDQILFILEMPQQGFVEAFDLSGKPFGLVPHLTDATRHFAGKRSNELTACGAEAIDAPRITPWSLSRMSMPFCSFGPAPVFLT
jgi:hypothetical protein